MGGTWARDFQVVLSPPQGTGEKYEAHQKFTCKAVKEGVAVITTATTLSKLPENRADQIPLLQFQPEGEILFDTSAGRMRSVQLKVDRQQKEHQGAGSSYHFQSSYTETFAGDK